MGLIVASILCLTLWLVLWSFGMAARDSAIVAFTLFLAATAVHTVSGQLTGGDRDSG